MKVIAQGQITLTSVNDAIVVSLTPSACVIKADYSGNKFDLSNAKTLIRAYVADKQLPGTVTISKKSNAGILVDVTDVTNGTEISIIELPAGIKNGSVTFNVSTEAGVSNLVEFSFTVVCESTMLDWLQDWETRKTEISGEYVITPKIFAGDKVNGKLTGVYIGPNSQGCGIYGYQSDKIIFSLDETGGQIGGWGINEHSIVSTNGVVSLSDSGKISATVDGAIAWQLKEDGSATFARGNVNFSANGDADFKGHITSTSGKIGNWFIGEHSLYNKAILINSDSQFIGIRSTYNSSDGSEPSYSDFYSSIKTDGGIAIYHQNAISYGIECWDSFGKKIFTLGYTNAIAGWNFDQETFYSGQKCNTFRQYTTSDGAISIGSRGMRGVSWYIDSDGEIDFVNGLIHFDKDGGTLSGWAITPKSLASKHIALMSETSEAGIFVATVNLQETSHSQYKKLIRDNGGVYLHSDGITTNLGGYTKLNGTSKQVFLLSSNSISQIAAWYFTDASLYTGDEVNVTGSFTQNSGDITIGSNGIRGNKWRLDAVGSGALAGGNISWDQNGVTKLGQNVYLSWNSSTGTGTKITNDGVFTGKISANNITAGTITTASIASTGHWALNHDGSGMLADGKITWNSSGLKIEGEIKATTGSIGAWIIDAQKRLSSSDASITLDATEHKITLTTETIASSDQNMISGFQGFGSIITLSTNDGSVVTRMARSSYTVGNTTYSAPISGVSYISPQGIFANLAGIRATSASSGVNHRASVCGLGNANFNKDAWDIGTELSAVVGVYGRASNIGTAPAYGGYFYDLKASGLILNRRFIHDNSVDGTQLESTDTLVISITNSGKKKTVFLPNDGIEGRVVIIKQMGAGSVRVQTSGGQKLFDDSSENEYYDFNSGYMGICVFGIWQKDSVTTQVWSVNRFKN